MRVNFDLAVGVAHLTIKQVLFASPPAPARPQRQGQFLKKDRFCERRERFPLFTEYAFCIHANYQQSTSKNLAYSS